MIKTCKRCGHNTEHYTETECKLLDDWIAARVIACILTVGISEFMRTRYTVCGWCHRREKQ